MPMSLLREFFFSSDTNDFAISYMSGKMLLYILNYILFNI